MDLIWLTMLQFFACMPNYDETFLVSYKLYIFVVRKCINIAGKSWYSSNLKAKCCRTLGSTFINYSNSAGISAKLLDPHSGNQVTAANEINGKSIKS